MGALAPILRSTLRFFEIYSTTLDYIVGINKLAKSGKMVKRILTANFDLHAKELGKLVQLRLRKFISEKERDRTG